MIDTVSKIVTSPDQHKRTFGTFGTDTQQFQHHSHVSAKTIFAGNRCSRNRWVT